jgi:hypothetical protein
MLYPATSRQYWSQCTSEQLYSIYNMLDWYYTPFIIDPQLPYMAVNKDTKSLSGIKGLNTLDGIKNSKGGPQQRLRPLVGPYAEAYVLMVHLHLLLPIILLSLPLILMVPMAKIYLAQ